MSIDFIVRIIGMIVFSSVGVFWGTSFGRLANGAFPIEFYAAIFGLVGALFGIILTPIITIRPLRGLRSLLIRIPAQSLFATFGGLIGGLIIAALLAFPVSLLPAPFGQVLPFLGVLIFGYLGIAIVVARQNDLFSVWSHIANRSSKSEPQEGPEGWATSRTVLLDTSVIIDGRISDVARTGFLPGTLVIPRFVLNELQYIADSADNLRRQRGRRGMEVLAQLQKEPGIPLQISDINVEGTREVDDKLVILARQLRCPILTNDYNLNRIAELQGVIVLNINELANAVKSILLPGEVMHIRIIQEGKEADQGVGYLDDGTMVVVENGRSHFNRDVNIVVTKVLQTAAGRMIFAKIEE
jgi:uncharacterized protein YacL